MRSCQSGSTRSGVKIEAKQHSNSEVNDDCDTCDHSRQCFLGLSNGDANKGYGEIDFALDLAPGGTLYVYQSGGSVAVSSYAAGDKLRVAVEGGVVKYRKNGTLIYTSTVTPTYPLLADSSLYSNGATLSDVILSGNLGGSGTSTAQINWLVTDQLGTPRMMFDLSGSLATVKRHDYMPFGEELFNGARTTAMGYAAATSTLTPGETSERILFVRPIVQPISK